MINFDFAEFKQVRTGCSQDHRVIYSHLEKYGRENFTNGVKNNI